jgi:hypothetical protein
MGKIKLPVLNGQFNLQYTLIPSSFFYCTQLSSLYFGDEYFCREIN